MMVVKGDFHSEGVFCYRNVTGQGEREAGDRALGPLLAKREQVSMSRCLNVSPGLGSQVSCLPFTPCHAARLDRRWRSGNRRADMRHETRDLAGGHETLRLVTPRSFVCPCNRDILCNSRRDCLRYDPCGQPAFASACRSAGTLAHPLQRIGCRAFQAGPC